MKIKKWKIKKKLVKNLLIKNELTQTEAATLLKISRSYLNLILNNKIITGKKIRQKIGDFFGIDRKKLFFLK